MDTPKKIAFRKISKDIPDRMQSVLEAIEQIQPCTYQDVSNHLKLPENSVANRISDLEKVGLIYTKGWICKNGRSLSLFAVCDEVEAKEKQRKLFNRYRREKDDLEFDLSKIASPTETTQKIIKDKITYCYNKLKLLNRFRIY